MMIPKTNIKPPMFPGGVPMALEDALENGELSKEEAAAQRVALRLGPRHRGLSDDTVSHLKNKVLFQ